MYGVSNVTLWSVMKEGIGRATWTSPLPASVLLAAANLDDRLFRRLYRCLALQPPGVQNTKGE
jgi:hypothetical protein